LTSSNNEGSISGFAEIGGISVSIAGLDTTSRSYRRKALKLYYRNSKMKVTFLSKIGALERSQRFVPASTSSANPYEARYRSEEENNSLVYMCVLLIHNWT